MITLAVFWLYPLVFSFVLSFGDYDVFSYGAFRWVGLENYARIFSDQQFMRAFGNTLFFVIGTTPVIIMLSLVLAVLINASGKLENFLRSAFFLPSIVSIVVISTIFKSFYSPVGFFNSVLAVFGIQGRTWLVDTGLAMPAIMVMAIWASVGYYVVLFLAALKSVPALLYEAARVDGATEWQMFRHITLPGIRFMIVFAVVINTIRSWQVFPEIFTLTRGGPLGTTDTMVHRLYETAFRFHEMGYASAMSWLLFFILLVLSVVQMKVLQERRK